VPNVDDRNQNNIIMDLVDDPVITHPDAVQRRFFRTGKMLTAGWAGIFGEARMALSMARTRRRSPRDSLMRLF
jgi:hypothetical protein